MVTQILDEITRTLPYSVGWESMFGRFADYYDIIYQRYNYEQECDFLVRILQKFHEGKVESILDLGCGTGSHDIILFKRGFEVVGLDSSDMMIEQAKKKAKNLRLKIDFIVQDMRELQLSKRFDCAICMFGGFGYLLSDEDFGRLLDGLRKVLKPNALFLFEFWNVDGLKPTPYRSWEKREREDIRVYRLSESNYNASNSILDIQFEFVILKQDKLVEEFKELHQLRVYSLKEMKDKLKREGFDVLHMLVGYAAKEEPIKDTFRVFAITKRC